MNYESIVPGYLDPARCRKRGIERSRSPALLLVSYVIVPGKPACMPPWLFSRVIGQLAVLRFDYET